LTLPAFWAVNADLLARHKTPARGTTLRKNFQFFGCKA
jgi:hypothetical protein